MLHAEDTLTKDCVVAPITFPTQPVLASSNIRNFFQGSDGFVDWKAAYIGTATTAG
jgi:hypothetical protein